MKSNRTRSSGQSEKFLAKAFFHGGNDVKNDGTKLDERVALFLQWPSSQGCFKMGGDICDGG